MKKIGCTLIFLLCKSVLFSKDVVQIKFDLKNGCPQITVPFEQTAVCCILDSDSYYVKGNSTLEKAIFFDVHEDLLLGNFAQNLMNYTDLTLDSINIADFKKLYRDKKDDLYKDFYKNRWVSNYIPSMNANTGELNSKGNYLWYTYFSENFIGLNYFSNLKRIEIDYKKNLITLNQNRKIPRDKCTKMRVLEPFCYEALVEIDGKAEWVIIDTGEPTCISRVEGNISERKEHTEHKRIVKIGNDIYSNVEFLMGNDLRLEYENYGVLKNKCKKNFLGNNLFKDHVITMDFEKKLFCIE